MGKDKKQDDKNSTSKHVHAYTIHKGRVQGQRVDVWACSCGATEQRSVW